MRARSAAARAAPTPGCVDSSALAAETVRCNVPGVVEGVGIAGGNIEFWPNNYGPANGAQVPGASDSLYDFGDQTGDPRDGYGCMQVHNHDAKQTLFAVNHWREGKGEGRRPILEDRPRHHFIDQAGGKPFFVWYAPMMPHDPHTPPERLLA